MTPKADAKSMSVNEFRSGLAKSQSLTHAIQEPRLGSASRSHRTTAGAPARRLSEVRGRGSGQTIRYAVTRCRLGWALVAATERGICMIELGDSPDALHARLQVKFGKATQLEAGAALSDWVSQVVAMIDQPSRVPHLPIDIQGTAFQLRVWEALRTIPAGCTVSYSEVANKIGAPKSARAVARACASNSIAIVIPCHRVVRHDGGLSGFRWGVERKQQLLEVEARCTAGN